MTLHVRPYRDVPRLLYFIIHMKGEVLRTSIADVHNMSVENVLRTSVGDVSWSYMQDHTGMFIEHPSEMSLGRPRDIILPSG